MEDEEEDFELLADRSKSATKAYGIREHLLQENMHKAFSIFLEKCTVAMVGRLESMTEWVKLRDSMDVLKFLEMLRKVT